MATPVSDFSERYFCLHVETPEVDLDALLEDLCVMERDIKESSVATLRRKGYNIDASTTSMSSTNSSIIQEENDDITEFHPSSPSYKMTSPVMVSVMTSLIFFNLIMT